MSFQLIQQLPNTRNINGINGNGMNKASTVNTMDIQSPPVSPPMGLPAAPIFVNNNSNQGPTDAVTVPVPAVQTNLTNSTANGADMMMIPPSVSQTMPVISLENPTNLTPMDIQRIINMSNFNNGK